jgi:hypothetical protein
MAPNDGFSRGAAADYLAQRFGGSLREDLLPGNFTPVASTFMMADPERVMFTVINLGANEIYICPGDGASSVRGIRIPANGGLFTTSVDEDGPLPAVAWSGVGVAANTAAFLISVRRDTVVV